MIRIRMTRQDLARTRFADRPAPAMELQGLVAALSHVGSRDHRRWRTQVCRPVDPARLSLLQGVMGLGCHAGFMHPVTPDIDSSIEEIVGAPRRQMRVDLEELVEAGYPPPVWTADLAAGNSRARAALADSMRHVFLAVVDPALRRSHNRLIGHHDRLVRRLAGSGIGDVLATLHPSVTWRPPMLEVQLVTPADVTMDLHGRGLLLVPSLSTVITVVAHNVQPILVYPVGAGLASSERRYVAAESGRPTLASLLGATRAAVLETIAERPGVATGSLATALGISAGSASEHATVLRNSRLITTDRVGAAAAHSVTDLGLKLLGHGE